MLGAIIGDIVGSRFEFNNHRSKEFGLFGNDGLRRRACCFTDDSVMTVAVADALLSAKDTSNDEAVTKAFILKMHEYGKRYPGAGYGGMFFDWLFEGEVKPYNSFGNGSAMRVSPCGWFGKTLEECMHLAELSAAVTHNHPEGIKGAVSVAAAIYLARTGKSKEEIRSFIEQNFYPDAFKKTLDEIRPTYKFNETCQNTVPQAFVAFYESTSFEDAIRCAVSLGGDCDTLTCITGGIAEAFYGIPKEIEEKAFTFLDDRLTKVVHTFQAGVKGS